MTLYDVDAVRIAEIVNVTVSCPVDSDSAADTVVAAVPQIIIKLLAVTVLESIDSLNVIVILVVCVALVLLADGILLLYVGAVVSAVVPYTELNQAVPIAAV